METLLVVVLYSKPCLGTLSSQIDGGEWSLLVVAKRLAASVKGPAHYSLPFTEPKASLPRFCSSPFPQPLAPPAYFFSHSVALDPYRMLATANRPQNERLMRGPAAVLPTQVRKREREVGTPCLPFINPYPCQKQNNIKTMQLKCNNMVSIHNTRWFWKEEHGNCHSAQHSIY